MIDAALLAADLYHKTQRVHFTPRAEPTFRGAVNCNRGRS
jgi:hypothetical protein